MYSDTVFDQGIAALGSILMPDSPVYAVLDDKQKESLSSLRKLLLAGDINRRKNFIPSELLQSTRRSHPGESLRFLLESYGGMSCSKRKLRLKSISEAIMFANSCKNLLENNSTSLCMLNPSRELPSKWGDLTCEKRNKLRQMLSWESICSWNFNTLELAKVTDGNALLFLGWAIIWSPNAQIVMADTSDRTGFDFGYNFKAIGLTFEKLMIFLETVQKGYRDENFYHNSTHAADVLQSTHALLEMGGKEYAHASVEKCALLLSAAAHDIGHPGTNNNFQINSQSDIALTYNDKSVLENMHAARISKLIFGKKPLIDIFEGWNEDRKARVRTIITESILATDMARHFKTVSDMKGYLTREELTISGSRQGDPRKFCDFEQGELAYEVLYFILHMADISNPGRPLPISTKWTDLVCNEFFMQGDMELKEGLPVSPLCDRERTNVPESQVNFNMFVVCPAYKVLGELVPKVKEEIMPLLDSNLTHWQNKI